MNDFIDGMYKNSTIVNVNIFVTDSNIITSKIECGEGRSFEEVLEGLKLCAKEIQWQIDNRQKCPANKTRNEFNPLNHEQTK